MPTVYVSSAPIKINAFATDFNSFAGDFEPSGMEGTSGVPSFGLTNTTVKVFPNLSAACAILEISDSYGLNYRRKILIGR